MNLQEQYIQSNYKSQTVKQMAEGTGLKFYTVRKIMIANDWANVNSRKKSLCRSELVINGIFNWQVFQDNDFIFKLDRI